jgi:hypothetical protein
MGNNDGKSNGNGNEGVRDGRDVKNEDGRNKGDGHRNNDRKAMETAMKSVKSVKLTARMGIKV